MRIVRWERLGDRRIRLVVTADGAYAVTVETLGPEGAWIDISLLADSRLRAAEAERRYTKRLEETRFRRTALTPQEFPART